jgi:hypothetical protein
MAGDISIFNLDVKYLGVLELERPSSPIEYCAGSYQKRSGLG